MKSRIRKKNIYKNALYWLSRYILYIWGDIDCKNCPPRDDECAIGEDKCDWCWFDFYIKRYGKINHKKRKSVYK